VFEKSGALHTGKAVSKNRRMSSVWRAVPVFARMRLACLPEPDRMSFRSEPRITTDLSSSSPI
jgi:hypothetical protein